MIASITKVSIKLCQDKEKLLLLVINNMLQDYLALKTVSR